MAPLDMELDPCYNKLCPLQLEEILTIAIAFICFATDNIKCMYIEKDGCYLFYRHLGCYLYYGGRF